MSSRPKSWKLERLTEAMNGKYIEHWWKVISNPRNQINSECKEMKIVSRKKIFNTILKTSSRRANTWNRWRREESVGRKKENQRNTKKTFKQDGMGKEDANQLQLIPREFYKLPNRLSSNTETQTTLALLWNTRSLN